MHISLFSLLIWWIKWAVQGDLLCVDLSCSFIDKKPIVYFLHRCPGITQSRCHGSGHSGGNEPLFSLAYHQSRLQSRVSVQSIRGWCTCTAWDSEIESLTSLDASLIELDRRKTRRRHRVTAALAPSKSCLLPCNANLHANSTSAKHGLPSPSFFGWSSFLYIYHSGRKFTPEEWSCKVWSWFDEQKWMIFFKQSFEQKKTDSTVAHRLVVIAHAIVKIRCKKETMESS